MTSSLPFGSNAADALFVHGMTERTDVTARGASPSFGSAAAIASRRGLT
jgi:hypothetical protein